MYLIDTSVWIDYLRKKNNQTTAQFITILDRSLPFGLTSVIYQEILQGASSLNDFIQLKEYLSTQRFFYPKDDKATYESAAKLYFLCRKKGITIRSSFDCLIAQIAIDNDLILLHNDEDFNRIKTIRPALRFA
jgi:predicted nucleic acid-binding protein